MRRREEVDIATVIVAANLWGPCNSEGRTCPRDTESPSGVASYLESYFSNQKSQLAEVAAEDYRGTEAD